MRTTISQTMAILLLGMLLGAAVTLTHGAPCDRKGESLSASTVAAISKWTFTTLDSLGDIGTDTSIAVDSNDKVHVSYFDNTHGDLKYATNADGPWVNHTLDSVGVVGKYTSIAIDSAGYVHISYVDWTNADLKYATNAEGNWTYQVVDSDGNVGLFSSIALDSNNNAHISYQDWTNYDLKYATNEGGSWSNQTIDSLREVGDYSSIAVDSQDNIHISYSDSTNDDLKYATNAGGTWAVYTVDSVGGVGFDTSIAVDSNDVVYISYHDEWNAVLKYATNAGGAWSNYSLDDSSYTGMCTSIAIDQDDALHISYLDYLDQYNAVLKYATDETGTWEYYSLEVVGMAGFETSIAIDSLGLVHIGYKDSVNDDLRYAFGTERSVPTLVASFDATHASGQAPLSVQFTSEVIGGVEPYTYLWTFGDGTTDSSKDPIHTYSAEGTYSVILTIIDRISSTTSFHRTIRVSEGTVEPVPEDDQQDLMIYFAAIPVIALAVTLVIAGIVARKRRVTAAQETPANSNLAKASSNQPQLDAGPTRAAVSTVPDEPRMTSIEQRLFKLREMRSKGEISEEEYEEKTRDLLKKW